MSSTTMSSLYSFQLQGVPVPFVNAIRRILLNETPTVEISNVEILENTTLMPHELMKHRVEMLPVNVRPSEEDIIRDTRILLRFPPADKDRIITSNDFVVQGARNDIMLKDREYGTPVFFLKLKKGAEVHITAQLTVNQRASQVCLASYNYHVDEERAERDSQAHEDKQLFKNFLIQKSYSVDEKGRPNHFDFRVESLGVVPPKELVRQAVAQIRQRIRAWSKEPIIRMKETGKFRVTTTKEGHTIGALAQVVGYDLGEDTCWPINYDVPHPLRPEMNLDFQTKKDPQVVLDAIATKVEELCDATISSIDK